MLLSIFTTKVPWLTFLASWEIIPHTQHANRAHAVSTACPRTLFRPWGHLSFTRKPQINTAWLEGAKMGPRIRIQYQDSSTISCGGMSPGCQSIGGLPHVDSRRMPATQCSRDGLPTPDLKSSPSGALESIERADGPTDHQTMSACPLDCASFLAHVTFP